MKVHLKCFILVKGRILLLHRTVIKEFLFSQFFFKAVTIIHDCNQRKMDGEKTVGNWKSAWRGSENSSPELRYSTYTHGISWLPLLENFYINAKYHELNYLGELSQLWQEGCIPQFPNPVQSHASTRLKLCSSENCSICHAGYLEEWPYGKKKD